MEGKDRDRGAGPTKIIPQNISFPAHEYAGSCFSLPLEPLEGNKKERGAIIAKDLGERGGKPTTNA